MKRSLILFVASFCLLWTCQSPDQQGATRRENHTPPRPKESIIAYPSRPEDWPMFMADLHFSGKTADQHIKPPLRLLWKYKTGGPIQASPVVANGIVYVGSTDQSLYALNAKRWELRWRFEADGPIRNAAAVWNDRVYFTARDNRVYALDAQTGELIWKFESGTWIESPPIISNEKVYVGAYTRKIYVLNANTGQLEAQLKSRVVIDDIEYGCSQGQLRPITPQHQVDLWRRHVPFTYSFPVIANGVAYIGARDNQIHAIDIGSKTKTWSYQTDGFIDSASAISDGGLYVTSYDGHVYAFVNQETETEGLPEEKRQIGTVVSDQVPVYTDKTKSSPVKLTLNDGVKLPIVDQIAGWYQVELPNQELGWLDDLGLGVFDERDGIQINTAVCSNVEALALIEGAEYPHWSPDGEKIAFLKRTNLSGQYWRASELWLTDSQAREFWRLHRGVFYNPHLSWSLDGNFIAFEAYDESNTSYVWAISWKTLDLIKLVRGDGPAWSPTANQIAFRRWEEGVDILYRINIDKTGLVPIARIPIEGRVGSFSYLDAPSWSPDGQQIAIGLDHQHYKSGHARVRVHKTDGTKIGEIPTQSQRVKQITWSADSSELAYVLQGNPTPDETLDKRLYVASPNALEQTQILKHTSPAWSPQGHRLAYMEREDCMGLRWKVWVLDRQTGVVLPIARTTINLTSVTWLPDSNRLCLWHTSEYLRGGEYKPAKTRGWIVEIAQ